MINRIMFKIILIIVAIIYLYMHKKMFKSKMELVYSNHNIFNILIYFKLENLNFLNLKKLKYFDSLCPKGIYSSVSRTLI